MTLKIKPLSLGDKAISMLVLVQHGADVFGSADADYMREFDKKWPGLIKIGPPENKPDWRKPPAHFGVRCTPRGKRMIKSYLAGLTDGV